MFVSGQFFLLRAYQNDVEIPAQVGITPVVNEIIEAEFGYQEDELVIAEPEEMVGTEPESKEDIIMVAHPGDGVSHLTRRALVQYEEQEGVSLTPEERAYLENRITNIIPEDMLVVGQEIAFFDRTLSSTFSEAKNLTDSQRAAWSRYVVVISR